MTTQTSGDRGVQLSHLEGALRVLSGNQVDRLVWRIGASVPRPGERPLAQFAALPALHDPRVLLPLDTSAAGLRASLYQQARSAASPAARLAARLLALAATVGAATPMMRQRLTVSAVDGALLETPLHSFLAELLRRRDLSLSLRLAPGRPNSKPVVQVAGFDGTVLAYAKFGWEPLTRSLIQNEARMLAALAEPTAGTLVNIPRIIHFGLWKGLDALVVAPVPSVGRMPRAVTDLPTAAIRCLAEIGRRQRSRLCDSGYWNQVRARIEMLSPRLPPAPRETLHAGSQYVERLCRDEPFVMSLRHGDWIPPNMVVLRGGGVSIWDWERGQFDAPQGIDAMQFVLFRTLWRGCPGRRFVRRVQRLGSAGLELQGVPARHALVLACLSLIETILWYAEASQAGRQVDVDRRFPMALQRIIEAGG